MTHFFQEHKAFCVFVAFWLLCSLITWILYAWDKSKSIKATQRFSEKTLLLWSIVGSLGALLGIYLHRHKSAHIYFPIIAFESLLLEGVLLYGVY